MRHKSVIALFAILLFSAFFQGIASAKFDYSLGLEIESAFDDNPGYRFEGSQADDASFLMNAAPEFEMRWYSDRSDYTISGRYLYETYFNNSELDDHDSFVSDSTWTYILNDNFKIIYKDELNVSVFGPDYVDRLGAQDDFIEYLSWTGISFEVNNFKSEVTGIWSLMEFEDHCEVLHGKKWDELGFQVDSAYQVIPEMIFMIGYRFKERNFDDNEVMPRLIDIYGYFGFKSILSTKTEVAVSGELFRIEYNGIPPRHTESDYNNYGVIINIKQPLAGNNSLLFSAFSEYRLSDRDVRLFYRDAGFDCVLNYAFSEDYKLESFVKFNQLDYEGNGSEDKFKVIRAGVELEKQLNKWLFISGKYTYLDCDDDVDLLDISSNRISLSLRAVFPF